MTNAQKIWQEVKDYILIAIGACIYCLGIVAFFLPYGITTGGVAGLATIFFYWLNIPIQYTYFSINIVLLLISIKVLGFKFSLKTIYGVGCVTVLLSFLQSMIRDASGVFPKWLGPEETFMACIIGAGLEGFGLAFIFLNNGSTGGTDIIAAIVHKYRDVGLGRVLAYCDIVIVGTSYFIWHDWKRMVFGFCTLIICNVMVDYVMNSAARSVQFMIFSRRHAKIACAINKHLNRGCTVLHGEGWYSKQEMKVLVVLARQRESVEIFRLIKEIDPDAFVSQSVVTGVFGNGFDRIKVKARKKGNNEEETITEPQQITETTTTA
jgi:uncharacterized membrane-anchored protein YitT (DUF2179 family)